MSPLRDTSVLFKWSSTAYATCTSADLHVLSDALEIEGTPLHGLALAVVCHSATGTSPHLTIELYASTSTTAPTTGSECEAIRTGLEFAAAGAHKFYVIPFVDPDARSLKVMVELTGSTATAALAADNIEVSLIENVGQDWSRAVSFHL